MMSVVYRKHRVGLVCQLSQAFEAVPEARGQERIDLEQIVLRSWYSSLQRTLIRLFISISLLWDLGNGIILGRCCQENIVSPGPSEELSKLLEDQQVKDATSPDLLVIVAWNSVPV